MCGIAGVIGGSIDYAPHLADMMQAMAHRGPDGQGTLTFEGGAVGAVRLAFLDLSVRGQQPIWSPDKCVAIIFNGEMYNHVAERERLAREQPLDARFAQPHARGEPGVRHALRLQVALELAD